MNGEKGQIYEFDNFRLDTGERQLLRDGKSVAIPARAFDLLHFLIVNEGRLVEKDELYAQIWDNQIVEESNLTVQMSAIRRALGENKKNPRYINTVSGYGYRFVGKVNSSTAGANGIIIERQTFEHIVVEEELETFDEAAPKRFLSSQSTPVSSGNRYVLYAVIGLLTVTLSGLSYLAIKTWSAKTFATSRNPKMQRLTTNGNIINTALAPDGKLFAYVASELGKTSLWLGYVSGGQHIQLRPPSETSYFRLIFSPDGRQLYFSSNDEQHPTPVIYRMPTFGGAVEKVAEGFASFSLSPDGKQIAFGRTDEAKGVDVLMVSPINGTEPRRLAEFPRNFSMNSISWSPDGRRLAFSCNREQEVLYHDLCLTDVSSGKTERMSLPTSRGINRTAWLKSGDGLIITSMPENSQSSVEHYDVMKIELPSGNGRQITNDLSTYSTTVNVSDDDESLLTIEHRQLNNLWVAPADDLSQAKQITFGSFGKYDGLWGLDWTPDGRLIYTNSNTESQIISVMDADGNREKDLTSPGFVDSALTVSNDGRYVVFHSNRGGNYDIWRMDADGGNLRQLTFGNDSYQPSVSPDNRYVYYKCWLKRVGELRRVPIDGGEPEVLTDKETGWTSFSPDGKYFAATYKTDKRRLAIFSAETNRIIKQFDVPTTSIFDMRPRWTPDSRTVVYRDNNFGYWAQSIDGGGEPQKLEGLPKEKLYTYAWSKDGKYFAFVRGQEIRDAVLINNFK